LVGERVEELFRRHGPLSSASEGDAGPGSRA
jgi:hypothetical protein